MNFRRAAAGLLSLAVVLTMAACGGTGNGPDQVSPQDWDDEDLPQWIRDLPEGTEPQEDDDTQEAFLYLLQAQAREGDEARAAYERVLESAEAAIESNPDNARGYYLAGEAHLGMGNLEEAARNFDRAEEIYPRYILDTEMLREQEWIDQYNEAVDYMLAEDMERATHHFELAHMIYQGRPDAMLQLARLYNEQGRQEDALELYTEAVELMEGPRSEGLDEELAESWAESHSIALFNKAQLLFEAERYSEAADAYGQIVERDPEDMMALSNMAIALAAAGRDDEARALYDDLMERPGLSARDYFLIGVGLYQVEEWEQAARAFGEASERVPGYRDALLNKVQSLFLAEDWEPLVEAGELLLQLDSHGGAAHQFLAQGLVRLGEEHQAVEIMEQLEALPFEVDDLQLQRIQGGVTILGVVINQHLDPGTEVNLRVFIYTVEGEAAGDTEVSVQVGQPEEAVQFQADFATDQDILGFRYEVVN